jgi:hypothetical protein
MLAIAIAELSVFSDRGSEDLQDISEMLEEAGKPTE